MPKALPIDYELVQALYLQGFSWGEISERVGNAKVDTLIRHAKRHGWIDAKRKAVAEMSERKQELVNSSFKERGERFLAAMANNAEKTLEQVESMTIPRNWDDLALRETVLERVNKRARLTFGLDSEAGNQRIINVSILTQEHEKRAIEVKAEKVLDVKQIESTVS